MVDEDTDHEKRLQFLREHFLPADVRANWIRIRRRMIAKAIRRRWKREARERRRNGSRPRSHLDSEAVFHREAAYSSG